MDDERAPQPSTLRLSSATGHCGAALGRGAHGPDAGTAGLPSPWAPLVRPPSPLVPHDAVHPRGADGLGSTTAAGHPPSTTASVRRVVRVADFGRLSRQVEHAATGAAQTAAQVEAMQEELRLTRHVRLGLDALQEVARGDRFPCGGALQRVLAQRTIERLKCTPARPRSRVHRSAGRGDLEQVAITFDVIFTRAGLDELVSMTGLKYSPRAGRRIARPVRVVQFPGATAFLRAVGLWEPSGAQNLMCRRFTRLEKTMPARPLLERFCTEDGEVNYILSRNASTGQVLVAVRESETYDVRRRAFKHPLVQKLVGHDSLPGLSETWPCFFFWRESTASAAMEWEGVDACGSMSVSLPCCTFEDLPADVAALVQSSV